VGIGPECWEWWASEPSAGSGGRRSGVEHSGWALDLSITTIFTATA